MQYFSQPSKLEFLTRIITVRQLMLEICMCVLLIAYIQINFSYQKVYRYYEVFNVFQDTTKSEILFIVTKTEITL